MFEVYDAEWEEIEMFEETPLKQEKPKKKFNIVEWVYCPLISIIFALLVSRILGYFLYGI